MSAATTSIQTKKQYRVGAIHQNRTHAFSGWLDSLEACDAWYRWLCSEYMPGTWRRGGAAVRNAP